jgi:hypothetical protein
VGVDTDLNFDFAISKDLDGLALASGALLDQILYGDTATLWIQGVNGCDVYSLILDSCRVLETAQLGKAHDQRQLTAFKSCADLVTGTSSLTTTTGCLSL